MTLRASLEDKTTASAPVALLDVLVAGELPHQPGGQALRVRSRIVRFDVALGQPALMQQEAAELEHGITAVFGPFRTVAFGQDVI